MHDNAPTSAAALVKSWPVSDDDGDILTDPLSLELWSRVWPEGALLLLEGEEAEHTGGGEWLVGSSSMAREQH